MKVTSRHLLGAALLLGLASAALAKPPNIILILTDDQGWNNTEMPMILAYYSSLLHFHQQEFAPQRTLAKH